MGENEFGPELPIKRADFVTVLGRIQNVDINKYKESKFDDVKSDAYYAPYVNWAEENKIVDGVGKNKFAPEESLTREQMVVIISKYLKFTNKELNGDKEVKFKYMDKVSPWAKEAVLEMAKAGIVNGMEDGTFSPKTPFTRAQVAQVLYNIYK
ncbi:MAG: S-layer homology domain-containing protein [Peptoniphilus sp.]|uniref:S-layer homology domain-containing protein n=1 Tax=Peptoniphilus sp. TaxID=1971214 RepID=UPI002A75D173|nr:S-layer homology domain-containing protein [Peptoniphilus sp.]MDY2987258.1 S-layer homology domain-containing protein [Peptoniphilus sp.]